MAYFPAVGISRWLSPCACRKGKKFTRVKAGVCLVTGGDGNSFVCGIESLNDERFAAAGRYSE
jgi:hypothetical protein